MRDHHLAERLEGQKQINTPTLIYILSYMERTILSLLRLTLPRQVSIQRGKIFWKDNLKRKFYCFTCKRNWYFKVTSKTCERGDMLGQCCCRLIKVMNYFNAPMTSWPSPGTPSILWPWWESECYTWMWQWITLSFFAGVNVPWFSLSHSAERSSGCSGREISVCITVHPPLTLTLFYCSRGTMTPFIARLKC